MCKAALARYWLLEHNGIDGFVALDDMCDAEGYGTYDIFKGRYINTNPETGFTGKDCRLALDILSNPS